MRFFFKYSFSLAFGGLVLGMSSTAFSQSVADNIRPVGQVCTNVDACTQTKFSDADNRGSVEEIDEKPDAATPIGSTQAPVSQGALTPPLSINRVVSRAMPVGAAGAPLLGDAEVWSS